MNPQDVDFRALGEEVKRLMEIQRPCATFTLKAFDAYTLVAALQGTARNPNLTDWQRGVVEDFARKIQGQLVAMARAVLGPGSLIERTMEMGFDPRFDVPRHERRAQDRERGRGRTG